MPRNFYILPDDQGRWVISEDPYISDPSTSYRSNREAFDQLRGFLAGKGLVMGQPFPEGTGWRVEALEPGEAPTARRPMLYSADALKTIEEIRVRLGRVLKEHALDLARQGGRYLVTDDDIWAAFADLDLGDLYPGSDEEADDG